MTYDKNELDIASDFNQRTFVRFPYLKFSAAESAKGKSKVKSWTLLRNDEDGNLQAEDLGQEVKVVFLKRGKFKLRKGSYITNEIVPGKDIQIDLYKINKETGKRNFYEAGEWQKLKERYGLSTFQYPYVLLNGEVVKFGVLPSSLSNYWEYSDSFKKGEKIYEFETILKSSDEPKVGEGGEYYLITFTRGEKLEEAKATEVAEKIMELNETLKAQETPIKLDEEDEAVELPELKDEEIPVVDEENIDVKDIPL